MPATVQLSRAELAQLAKVEPNTINKYRERAAAHRRAGTPQPGDIPEPSGYIGRSPYWLHGRGQPITRWLNSRGATTT